MSGEWGAGGDQSGLAVSGPEIFEVFQSDIYCHKGHKGGTEDTELDVDKVFCP